MQLQNARKERENLKTQLNESRDELREGKELNSLLQKEVLKIQHQADSHKEELVSKQTQVEKLENANRDLVSKIADLNRQISQRRMAFESRAEKGTDVETELSWFQSKFNELLAVLESLKAEDYGHQRDYLVAPIKELTTKETDEETLESRSWNCKIQNCVAPLLNYYQKCLRKKEKD